MIRSYLGAAPVTDSDAKLLGVITQEMPVGLLVLDITVKWAESYVLSLKTGREDLPGATSRKVKNLAPSSIRKRVESLARVLDWHWHWRRDTPAGGAAPPNPLRSMPKGYSTYTASEAKMAKARGLDAKRDVQRNRRLSPEEEQRVVRVPKGEVCGPAHFHSARQRQRARPWAIARSNGRFFPPPAHRAAAQLHGVWAKSRNGKDMAGYFKRMPDSTVLHLEEVRTGRHQLAAHSMRRYPATTAASSVPTPANLNARSDSGDRFIVVDMASLVKLEVARPRFGHLQTQAELDRFLVKSFAARQGGVPPGLASGAKATPDCSA